MAPPPDQTAPGQDGRSLRKEVPRGSHGGWTPSSARPDPVALIEGQTADRLSHLAPVRRVRMAESPLAFYRGAALIMAHDLADTPTTGLEVQLCGDAHLSNFGVFASPERDLVFDLNDFDETLPGPWEWDVKRLAASFVIAAKNLGFDEDDGRDLAEDSVRSYREVMQKFAGRGWLETWYSRFSLGDLADHAQQEDVKKKRRRQLEKFVRGAKKKDHLRAARKLVEHESGRLRLRSEPPLLVPLRSMPVSVADEQVEKAIIESFASYRRSLSDETGHLLDRYQVVDLALKVVGVGSVGTRCFVALLVGRGQEDILLLQVKEAGRSVLEEHLAPSRYSLSGQRVVEGQRLMQAASDIFLGWSEGTYTGSHYYWRQLKDWKASIPFADADGEGMGRYARVCGWTLARAHAVSGDPAAIAAYLGSSSNFERAIGEFAVRYARQNDLDYEAFVTEIRDGRLAAEELQ
ncbi:MAG: DUF2252 domain-containing protein [Acidimicrobiia bacterium]